MDTAEERELIERVKQGDQDAFEALYNLYKQRVYSLCLRMTKNAADAEDLTQEAFLTIYQKLGTFRGDSQLATWLHRVTVNVVLMKLRKKKPPVVSLDQPIGPDGEKVDFSDAFVKPDPRLEFTLQRRVLEHAIEQLIPAYRIAFLLHCVEGYENAEIAKMFGFTVNVSKLHVYRARMKLLSIIDPSAAALQLHPAE